MHGEKSATISHSAPATSYRLGMAEFFYLKSEDYKTIRIPESPARFQNFFIQNLETRLLSDLAEAAN